MPTLPSMERRLCVRACAPLRKSVIRFVALAAVAVCYSQASFAQMERLNAEVNRHNHGSPPPPPVTTPPATTTPPAPAVPNPNCTLIVPANPLSANGLATPYQLVATDPAGGPCNEGNGAQGAFVQAAILDMDTGAISIYEPLVVDKGTAPAAKPVVPTLPNNSVVALWFGFDGTNLTLAGTNNDTLTNARCVNGLPNSIFSQVSFCNTSQFFKAADTAVNSGKLVIPALGTGSDGKPCPTLRSFTVVDQDQSDNVTTAYLLTAQGTTAQSNQANLAALTGATTIINPGDNILFASFITPALGCTALKAPDLTNPGQMTTALPLNELQARYRQATPVALVPDGDPMAEVNGVVNLTKTNLYRKGMNQPVAGSDFFADTTRYCRQLLRIAPASLLGNQTALTNFASLAPAAGNNLFTFLAQRFVASYQLLNCQSLINQPDPVSVTTNADGVAVSATVSSTQLATSIAAIAGLKAADDEADSAFFSFLSRE
jgi:hypothetical protein